MRLCLARGCGSGLTLDMRPQDGSPVRTQVSTRVLSDKEQKRLLYRRQLQFGTGELASEVIASSSAAMLSSKKSQVTRAIKDVQSKTPEGALQQLMMQHFKETLNPRAFYTLPLYLVKTLPIKELSSALTSMLSVAGQPAQPSGTLPLLDKEQSLPLIERDTPVPIEDGSLPWLGALTDESDGLSGGAVVQKQRSVEQLLAECGKNGLLVFRVADKNPHLKKRPLHSVDNVVSADVAIRLYKLDHTVLETDEIPMLYVCLSNVQPGDYTAPDLSRKGSTTDYSRVMGLAHCWWT